MLFGNKHLFALECGLIQGHVCKGDYLGGYSKLWLLGEIVKTRYDDVNLLLVQHELSRIVFLASYRTLNNSKGMNKEELFKSLCCLTNWEDDENKNKLLEQAELCLTDGEVCSLVQRRPYEYGLRYIQDTTVRLCQACILTHIGDGNLLDVGAFFIVDEYSLPGPYQRLLWKYFTNDKSENEIVEVVLPPRYFDNVAEAVIKYIDNLQTTTQ